MSPSAIELMNKFRKVESELFDANGKRRPLIAHGVNEESMRDLINQMEDEITRLEKWQIKPEMIKEIYDAFEKLGAKSDLLGTIGSYKDTLDDDECYENLRNWNAQQ